MSKIRRDIVHRWEKNPVITLENIDYRCNSLFNASVTKYNQEYLMLIRVESLQGYSVFILAHSPDGYQFRVDSQPAMVPCADLEPFCTYEERGIEDPRIILIEGVYYIIYTACSQFGYRIAIAKTQDFKDFQRVALISEPGNKDGVLFSRKIKGQYVRLDRPFGHGVGKIWISYSNDLIHWGNSKVLISPRAGYWDSYRIGASAPPIETDHGWLEIYHGVKKTSSGPVYRLGSLLLDLENPAKVLGRSDIPILSPREYYERVGDVDNVVFSCGAILEKDGEVKIYYGAADTCICLGTAKIDELINRCLSS